MRARQETSNLALPTLHPSLTRWGFLLPIPSPRLTVAFMALFTAQNAREMALRSHLARKAPPEPTEPPAEAPQPAEAYVARQLSRTRKQIDLLNDRLDDPKLDWKAVKAIADAKARLYEIEAALAGRPKPGNLKPTAPARPRRYAVQEQATESPAAPPGASQAPSCGVDTTANSVQVPPTSLDGTQAQK